jgi:ankyrin repeat protein
MNKQLPERSDLEQLKTQAKDLLDEVRTGVPEALARIGNEDRGTFALHDAQRVLAREYGFPSWVKLKAHVEAVSFETAKLDFHAAFKADDAAQVRRLLKRFQPPAAALNTLIPAVRSPQMLDALLEYGADLNAKSDWWAGGFGVLHQAKPELAHYAISRGAYVDIHAAARLGMVGRVEELLASNPALVAAKGGDGQTPLHVAANVEIADQLLRHGADIDAVDVDHVSTPAQYMIRDRQKVAAHLVARGCRTDVLMLAALGDLDGIRALLDRDPDCIRMRVSEEFFPMVGGKNGGTIYQWTLGWYVSALDVAREFEHRGVERLLGERAPALVRFLDACWRGKTDEAKTLARANGISAGDLAKNDRRLLADAARNNRLAPVQTMLELGFPLDGTSQHRATALHWAAYHGNVAMLKSLLAHHPALETRDADFNGPPLGWAIHGSREGWARQSGDYATTVELLLKAGARNVEKAAGTEEVKAVLRRFGATDS